MQRADSTGPAVGLCTWVCGSPVRRYQYAVPIPSFEQSVAPFSVQARTLYRNVQRPSIDHDRANGFGGSKRDARLADVRLKAATGRYRNASRRRAGFEANQGVPQRSLIFAESSNICRPHSDCWQITETYLTCISFTYLARRYPIR